MNRTSLLQIMKNIKYKAKHKYSEIIKLQKNTKNLDAFDIIFLLYFSTSNKGSICLT